MPLNVKILAPKINERNIVIQRHLSRMPKFVGGILAVNVRKTGIGNRRKMGSGSEMKKKNWIQASVQVHKNIFWLVWLRFSYGSGSKNINIIYLK